MPCKRGEHAVDRLALEIDAVPAKARGARQHERLECVDYVAQVGVRAPLARHRMRSVDNPIVAESPLLRCSREAENGETEAARSHKPKVEVDAPDRQPANRKKVAAKKPARKNAKKAPSKSDAKTGAKIADRSKPEISKTKTPRQPLSSTSQDVVKIGSDEPKAPRRGWLSRS